MNKDQIKGSVNEVAGNVQKNVGKATGSTEHQVKGAAREVAGKVQKTFGDVKEDAKNDARHDIDRVNKR
ncbi:MAG: CsbD family protein [Steroidobacteraceae bacterium]